MTVLFVVPEHAFFNFNETDMDPSIAITDDYAGVRSTLSPTIRHRRTARYPPVNMGSKEADRPPTLKLVCAAIIACSAR